MTPELLQLLLWLPHLGGFVEEVTVAVATAEIASGSIPNSESLSHTLDSPTGLCPDWETWDPNKPVDNAREAMQQADDWLGVPQVSRQHNDQ